MESIWKAESEKKHFDALKSNIKTDVLIVGGGMAGILTGYMLKKSGVECVVVEENEVFMGVTADTTAKITFHHGAIFNKMLNRYGTDALRLYIESQADALNEFKNISKNFDCDFCEENSFVYSVNNREKIEKEVLALNKAGCKAEFVESLDLPFFVSGAVCIKNQAQFNPLKFGYAITDDLNIYEKTKVLDVSRDGVVTDRGNIEAQKIIIATHFPFINKYGAYFIKMYQHRSYVIALKDAQKVNGIYVDENNKGMSFRNYKDFLLVGGGGHRTGKKGGSFRELEKFAAEKYPNSKEFYRFATQDCETLDDIPYIGKYSKKTPNLFVATGFNKWGMTSSMVSAKILCDLVQGNENKYSKLYSPQRSMLHGQLFLNALESAVSILTPTVPRCSHMGCALKYNYAEHSWDCPCHGSRFTKNGELLNNPATKDLK